ncbi:MAG: hypothetical protein J2P50_15640 [Hyphomicrobiaceae bacterium]|nr:hypothetical protein [Hyphomicrobiaceae bacterium]
MPSASFLSYWYLQLPSVLLAALIYLLLIRLAAGPFLSADTVAMRLLAAVTNPVVKTVNAITPRVVPSALVVVFAIVWLLSLRILLHQLLLARRMFG